MPHSWSLLKLLAKSLYATRAKIAGPDGGIEDSSDSAAAAAARGADRGGVILRSSGVLMCEGSNNIVSLFSKRGEKGVNQDCSIVWEVFGGQEDIIFCGVFDGHGPWGHYISKNIREALPSSLLCRRKEALALVTDETPSQFELWMSSYLKACATVDMELKQHHRLDSFHSGTTALSFVKQGELMVIANVGDSRAVLATTADDGSLVPLQLTVDFKPNLPHKNPQEAARIIQNKGRVFCLSDEPGVHRVWPPGGRSRGLATSRAFGDYCIKDFGLISVPQVTQTRITAKDRFIILATDGVWDVVSNEEAVKIVSSSIKERGKSAKRLVEFAVREWRRKRRGVAADDCSAICLFFHP